MALKKQIPVYPVSRGRVYDTDPDAITRPDTVPGALRFADDSKPSSVEQRAPRELAAYPGFPMPPDPPDDPTIVDRPLRLRSGTHPTEARLARGPSDVPRSGPRHRTVSTVPPPRLARRSLEPTLEPTPDIVAHARQTPRPAPAEPAPATRRHPAWQLLLAGSLTTALSIAFGTSLADGSLRHLTEGVFASTPKREKATPMAAPAPRPPTRHVEAPPSAPSVPVLEADEMPVVRFDDVPVVRFEDLPLAKTSEPPGKTKRRGAVRRR